MISFCHPGSSHMASYRYRCSIPAEELRAEINNPHADVLIFTKPNEQDIPHAIKARERGAIVLADFCDLHFGQHEYRTMLTLAHGVTCPTQWFADYLREDHGVEATVVPDPYEFPEMEPHCNGNRLLWFGHGLNINSLQRIAKAIEGYPLSVVSNIEGFIPWSLENLTQEFAKADIVLMPETAPYKSPNRTIEAVRQGCFVVAEPHPAINEIPGIWLGNIKKGIEWAVQNPLEANRRTATAQAYIKRSYSPQIQASAWRTAIRKARYSSTSEAETLNGPDGFRSIVMSAVG